MCLADPMRYKEGITILTYTARVLDNMHHLGFAYNNLRPDTVIYTPPGSIHLTRFEKCVDLRTVNQQEGVIARAQDIGDLIYLASLLFEPHQYKQFKEQLDFQDVSVTDVHNALAFVLNESNKAVKSCLQDRRDMDFMINQGTGVDLGLFLFRP
ncbi:hypothetical protein Pmani_025544 [Petrolisthes manimaculis]|uniref:Protein kinase domain-containing protein n=1 Tax=Petrolisthes manimaculis TaxID=1843537 RepID=A0AAE1U125_9EUCA|nr:hypothetical protein Pmani_025544 [Petrolisthes manimaculis]